MFIPIFQNQNLSTKGFVLSFPIFKSSFKAAINIKHHEKHYENHEKTIF